MYFVRTTMQQQQTEDMEAPLHEPGRMRALLVITIVLTVGVGTFALLEMPLKLEQYPNQEHCLTPVRSQDPLFVPFSEPRPKTLEQLSLHSERVLKYADPYMVPGEEGKLTGGL